MSSTRSIVVDDTSPLISYDGPWTGGDTYSANATFGDSPFNNTLHALSGSGNFTFNFTGTSVSVIGSFMNSSLPSWTCFIDGNPLISNNFSNFDSNNVEICSLPNIAINTTPNNLTVVASGTSDNPFLFDYIQYVPDNSTILDNATVEISALDSQIQYDSRWNMSLVDGQVQTSVQGASMTFDFVGIQITWITGIPIVTGLVLNASVNSSAFYSIDNGTQFSFLVTAQNSMNEWASFQSPILSPGSHSLFVEYYGDNGIDDLNGSVPLILDYFIVQNLTIPPLIPSPPQITTSTTQRPTATQSPTITQIFDRAGLSEGAIAGVVIGSVVGLALIIFILIWTIRFIKGPQEAEGPEPVPHMGYNDGRV